MDWKTKCAEYWEKAKKYGSLFLKFCGKAWKWTCAFAADAWVWLRKVLKVTNIWLTKAKVWLIKALAFLGKCCKHLLGWIAVLVLKIRKWFLKTMPQLRSWWKQRKVRKCKANKKENKKMKPPASEELACAQIPVQEIEEEVVEEFIELDPVPVTVPAEPVPVETVPAPARSEAPNRKSGAKANVFVTAWKAISGTIVWIYRKRKYILAAPVAFFAVKMAIANANRLPDTVGLDIQASGEFARMVSRQQAVLGPLAVTAFCLVLVLCSKKPLLPWLISMFTLILPLLIWMTNYYA